MWGLGSGGGCPPVARQLQMQAQEGGGVFFWLWVVHAKDDAIFLPLTFCCDTVKHCSAF